MKIILFDKDIGNISKDTYVGVNYANAWTICIYETYHKYTELSLEELEKFIKLLRKAEKDLKMEMKSEKKRYDVQ